MNRRLLDGQVEVKLETGTLFGMRVIEAETSLKKKECGQLKGRHLPTPMVVYMVPLFTLFSLLF